MFVSLKSCAEIRVSFILSFLTATLSSLVVILQLFQISVVTGPCDLWLLIIITIIIIITFIQSINDNNLNFHTIMFKAH